MRGRAAPAQRERYLTGTFLQIEIGEVAAYGAGKLRRNDLLAAFVGWLQHLQVLARQQVAGARDVDGVAGELHAVLGCSDRGGADTLPGRQQRPRQRAFIEAARDGRAQQLSHVAELAGFPAVDVLADAARDHDAVDASEVLDRVGQVQMLDGVGQGTLADRRNQRIGHPFRDACHFFPRRAVARLPLVARLRREMATGGVEPHDAALVVDDLQPPADVHRGHADDAAFVHYRQLRGAAADVDIEYALVLVVRDARRARPVGGKHRFQVVAGGGAYEFAAFLGEQRRDRLGVLPAQRLPGQDHHAGIDLVGMQPGLRVGLVDDFRQPLVVDPFLVAVRSELDRRLEQGFARNHAIAAGEVLAEPAQVDAR